MTTAEIHPRRVLPFPMLPSLRSFLAPLLRRRRPRLARELVVMIAATRSLLNPHTLDGHTLISRGLSWVALDDGLRSRTTEKVFTHYDNCFVRFWHDQDDSLQVERLLVTTPLGLRWWLTRIFDADGRCVSSEIGPR